MLIFFFFGGEGGGGGWVKWCIMGSVQVENRRIFFPRSETEKMINCEYMYVIVHHMVSLFFFLVTIPNGCTQDIVTHAIH